MSSEKIIQFALANVPNAVACGLVDMDSGMLLDVKTLVSHPPEILELISAATKDLFEGHMVIRIEETFKRIRGVDSDEHYFQEILVGSTNLWHYFGRLNAQPGVVVTVVCGIEANIGMVLRTCREIRNDMTI